MAQTRSIRVIARDGEYVGRLEHVVAHNGSQRPTGLVIERGGDQLVVPLTAVGGSEGDSVTLKAPAGQYRELPPFERQAYRVIDEEIEDQDRRRRLEDLGIDEDFQIGSEEDELEVMPAGPSSSERGAPRDEAAAASPAASVEPQHHTGTPQSDSPRGTAISAGADARQLAGSETDQDVHTPASAARQRQQMH